MYSNLSEDPAERAKALIVHYFTLAGVVKDQNNEIEIGNAIQYIIDASLENTVEGRLRSLESDYKFAERSRDRLYDQLSRIQAALSAYDEAHGLPEELKSISDEVGSWFSP